MMLDVAMENLIRELFDHIFFFGTLVIIPFAAFVALFQIACVIWAPFAALMCAIISHRMGLSIWKYALAGAICSVLMLAPWIFLMQRMRNRRISYDEIVNPIYFGLFTTWGVLIFGNIVVHITLMGIAKLLPIWLGGGSSYEGEELILYWRLLDVMIVPTVISVPIFIPSLLGFIRRLKDKNAGMIHASADIFLRPAYLLPFAGTSATTASIMWLNRWVIL